MVRNFTESSLPFWGKKITSPVVTRGLHTPGTFSQPPPRHLVRRRTSTDGVGGEHFSTSPCSAPARAGSGSACRQSAWPGTSLTPLRFGAAGACAKPWSSEVCQGRGWCRPPPPDTMSLPLTTARTVRGEQLPAPGKHQQRLEGQEHRNRGLRTAAFFEETGRRGEVEGGSNGAEKVMRFQLSGTPGFFCF